MDTPAALKVLQQELASLPSHKVKLQKITIFNYFLDGLEIDFSW